MIRTDRQLAIAKRKRQELLDSCAHLDEEDAEVYRELARDLQSNIEAYVSVRDGQVNLFSVESVDSLASAAVSARVARGWSQRELAEELGVSEQSVQKDEARGYENVGLAKIAEVIEALGYGLVGTLRPVHLPRSEWSGPTGIRVGFPVVNNVSRYLVEAGSQQGLVYRSVSPVGGWCFQSDFRLGDSRGYVYVIDGRRMSGASSSSSEVLR